MMKLEVGMMLFMEDDTSQGMWVTFRSWKKTRNEFSLKHPEEMQPYWHSDFSSVRSILQ